MSPVRALFNAISLVALWLLAVSLLLGPVGPAGLTGDTGCSCSCEAEADDDAEHDDQAHDDDACDDEEPIEADRECPDDCCGASPSPSLALAIGGLTISTDSPQVEQDLELPATDSPAVGVRVGVFRPPQSIG